LSSQPPIPQAKTSWKMVASLPMQEDPSLLSQYLWQQNIVHQFKIEGEQRLLLVMDESAKIPVIDLLRRVLSKDALKRSQFVQASASPPVEPAMGSFTEARRQGLATGLRYLLQVLPCTLVLLLLSIIGLTITYFDRELSLLRWLSVQDVMPQNNGYTFANLDQALAYGQWWRLWTPSLLQFNLIHFLVNALWLVELGRRIEASEGSSYFLGLLVLIAPAANLSQYFLFGPGLFGGLSGLVYGLLGFMACYSGIHSGDKIKLPLSTLALMLSWLVLIASGVLDAMLGQHHFNGMYLGGLLFGCLLGLVIGLYKRVRSVQQTPGLSQN